MKRKQGQIVAITSTFGHQGNADKASFSPQTSYLTGITLDVTAGG